VIAVPTDKRYILKEGKLMKEELDLQQRPAQRLTRSNGYPKIRFMTVDQMEETGEYSPELIEYLRKYEVGAMINKGELPLDNAKD
jgi:hypothetical protein